MFFLTVPSITAQQGGAGKDPCHSIRQFTRSEILLCYLAFTWINVQECMHMPRYFNTHWHWLTFTHSSFLTLTHAHTYIHSGCLLWAEREEKMKNEPNNVRPKAAPIKRINGSKVCKDRVEVLWLLLNINSSWMSVVEGSLRVQRNHTFCRN